MSRPSAAPGGRSPGSAVSRQQGFSLVEMLVALVVVVLVTSLVTFSINSGGQDVRLEALVRDLSGVAGYALDEAQMTGVDYGLLLQEESQGGEVIHSYRWLERQLDGWDAPRSGKDIFETKRFPPGLELELELEDAPFVELALADDGTEDIAPQVIFYASGETTGGAINVRRRKDGDLLWRIEWDLLGRFDLLPRGEEPVDEDFE
jgi:type II secretion system protein H